MTVEEAWLGVTRNAAKALERPRFGTLVAGGPGDFVIWRCSDPGAVPYHYSAGALLIDDVYVNGTQVTMRPSLSGCY